MSGILLQMTALLRLRGTVLGVYSKVYYINNNSMGLARPSVSPSVPHNPHDRVTQKA